MKKLTLSVSLLVIYLISETALAYRPVPPPEDRDCREGVVADLKERACASVVDKSLQGGFSIDKDVETYAYFVKAMGLTARGRYEDAAKHFSSAIQRDPQNLLFYFIRGNVYIEMNKLDLAAEDLSRVSGRNLRSEVSAYRKSLEKNVSSSEPLNLSSDAAHKTQLSRQFIAMGDLQKFSVDFALNLSRAIRMDFLHNSLGVLFAKEKIFETATQEFTQAVTINPRYVEAHENLGRINIAERKYEEAISKFQYAKKIMPYRSINQQVLAMLYASVGELEKARFHFKEALLFDPKNPNILISRGNFNAVTCNIEQSDVDYAEAEKLLGTKIARPDLKDKILCTENNIYRVPSEPEEQSWCRPMFPEPIAQRVGCRSSTDTGKQ